MLIAKFLVENAIRGFLFALLYAAAKFFITGQHIGEIVFLLWFAAGTLMMDGETSPCAPAELRLIAAQPRTAELVLTEGKYHQVRRMFAATGNHVETLHRECLGGLSLPDGMAPGEWRLLREDEIALIFK